MRVPKVLLSLVVVSTFCFLACETAQVTVAVPDSSDEKQGVKLVINSYDKIGVNCTITNNTQKSLLIDWNRSSINYNDHSSNIVVSGQKSSKAGSTDVPLLRLPASATNSFSVYPIDCVKFKLTKGYNNKNMILKKDSVVFISISTFAEDSEKETVLTAKFTVDK